MVTANLEDKMQGNIREDDLPCTIRVRVEDSEGRVLLVSEKGGKVIGYGVNNKPIYKRAGTGIPGGRVKNGETLLEAALRELQEETGVVADIEPEPVFVDWRRSSKVYVFRATNPRGEIKIKSEEDIVKAFWVLPARAHGSFRHDGGDYPAYESHMNWINDIF